jgi:nitrate/nitrite transporter NarK
MKEILIPIAITFGAGMGAAIFAKIFPREKVLTMIKPSAIACGVAFNAILVRWLGKGSADKVEESILCTFTFAIRNWLDIFESTILKDNNGKK